MLILILAFALSVAASGYCRNRLRKANEKYNRETLRCNLSGAEVAQRLLEDSGLRDVMVKRKDGLLTNHYNPQKKVLYLSTGNHDGRSIAAVGLSAHEVGHAMQDAEGSRQLAWRISSIRTTVMMSGLFVFVPVLLVIFRVMTIKVAAMILMAGWSGIMIMNLLTLAVEFDASRRVRELMIRSRLVRAPEEEKMDEMLTAAGLTYVATMVSSVWVWIYHLIPMFGKSRV